MAYAVLINATNQPDWLSKLGILAFWQPGFESTHRPSGPIEYRRPASGGNGGGNKPNKPKKDNPSDKLEKIWNQVKQLSKQQIEELKNRINIRFY